MLGNLKLIKGSLSLAVLLTLGAPELGRSETVLFNTGFEAPTYSPGPIGGGYYAVPQFTSALGWYAWPLEPFSADPSPWAVVTGTRAASGSQSLKMSIDPTSNSQIAVGRTFNPGTAALSAGFGVSLRLYLDQAADSDVSWSVSFSDGFAGLLGITLTPSGQVMYGHRFMSTSSFFNPGFDLKNKWLDVSLEVNPIDASDIMLRISNGSQNWQQVVSSPGGAVTWFSMGGAYPTFPLYKSGAAYVDDLRLGYNLTPVPEPASGALLLLGAAGVVLLRKRHL